MEVTFHDRNHDVPAEEVRYALRKLDSVVGQFDLVARAEVEFDRDLKKRATPLHVVKVNLHLIGHRLSDLHAEETGRELRTTVDLVIDKIGGEVATLKDRITAHP
jgi:ribosome-associated translation inhibitor RaiA